MANPQPPVTRLTLISALCHGLRWEEFVALYGRVILGWGRRDFGLQESDAENLRQEVLLKVWKNIRGFEPAKGRFRNWLYICTRNAVYNLNRRNGRMPRPQGGNFFDLEGPCLVQASPAVSWDKRSDCNDPEKALRILEDEGFDGESLEEAVARVRERVQPSTWKAFLLFEFCDMKAKEIGPRLDMKPATVNQAVHRVRQLLLHELTLRRAGPQESRG